MNGKPDASKVVQELYYLPSIIARLGIGVAEAQQAFNATYVNTLRELLIMASSYLSDDKSVKLEEGEAPAPVPVDEANPDKAESPAGREAIIELIKTLAPPQYQFTETTLDFSADLSQSMRAGGGLGIGGGLGAFMINASVSGSYGYDFRAAARVTTKLHAVFLQKDQKFLETMLARAREISAEELKTKDLALVDMKEVNEQLGKFAEEANVANVIKFIEANREPE